MGKLKTLTRCAGRRPSFGRGGGGFDGTAPPSSSFS